MGLPPARVLAVLALVLGSLLPAATASAAMPPRELDERCAAGFDDTRVAVVHCPGGVVPMATERASASADPDAAAVLAAQDVPASLLMGSVVLLVIGAVLAATIGSRLLRP